MTAAVFRQPANRPQSHSVMCSNPLNAPAHKIREPLAAQRPSFVPTSRRVHKDCFTDPPLG